MFPDAGVDLERANAARVYDFFLGGAQHVVPSARVAYVDHEPRLVIRRVRTRRR